MPSFIYGIWAKSSLQNKNGPPCEAKEDHTGQRKRGLQQWKPSVYTKPKSSLFFEDKKKHFELPFPLPTDPNKTITTFLSPSAGLPTEKEIPPFLLKFLLKQRLSLAKKNLAKAFIHLPLFFCSHPPLFYKISSSSFAFVQISDFSPLATVNILLQHAKKSPKNRGARLKKLWLSWRACWSLHVHGLP